MSDKPQMLPVNCTLDKEHPHKVGELGFDPYGKPVFTMLCRRHNMISSCSMMAMLQAWREIAKGNEQTMRDHLARLKKAVLDVETDLEDIQQKKVAG